MKPAGKVTRRRFVRTLAVGSIAMPAIVPASVFGRAGKSAPSERITVAVIGCGKMANDYHLPELLGLGDVQTVAVCEVDQKRREHAKRRVEKAYNQNPGSNGCAAYSDFRARSDFFSPHLFCLGGVTSNGQTFARHLDVPPDLPEDPFTGSATGGMAAYLWRYGWIDSPVFVAEQGHWMNRPGEAFVEIVGDRDDIQTIRVGGSALTVLRGSFEF
jgi:hypothetical protein